MSWFRLRKRGFLGLAVVLMWLVAPAVTTAQIGGVGGGGFGGFGGGGFGGGGVGGVGGGGAGGQNDNAGVIVDAQGVLRKQVYRDPTGRTGREKVRAAMARLDPTLTKPSLLRKISLTRLEKAVAERLANGQQPTDEMKYLAGMLRIQYVFFYPETGDIVIAGPAEGFATDMTGRVRGLSSGRAVIQLEDLIVALRAFAPGANPVSEIGVSIDPTPEGLARMQQTLARIGRQITRGSEGRIAQMLKQALGFQTIRIDGISPRTHFAQVLVEADYRMKLIGIGLERPPVRIVSYVAKASPRSVARNALQRWYFTPYYECLRVTPDEQALELVGWGVRLVGQSELVREGGGRVENARTDPASQAFCNSFTENYPRLADLEPVYAQLRNLIDMTVAAAFIQSRDFYGQAGWDLGVFADETKLPVETYEAPQKVESAINVKWKGNTLMTPIGGGVDIKPTRAIQQQNLLPDENNKVQNTRKQIDLSQLPAGQWWWD